MGQPRATDANLWAASQTHDPLRIRSEHSWTRLLRPVPCRPGWTMLRSLEVVKEDEDVVG